MKFREHKGSLDESMKTLVELADRAALVAHLAGLLKPFNFVVTDDLVKIMVGHTVWWNIVRIEGYGVAGFVEVAGYGVEPTLFGKLRVINERLFDDKVLSADQRRDLANEMHVILQQIENLPL